MGNNRTSIGADETYLKVEWPNIKIFKGFRKDRHNTSKTLIGHFSTNKQKYILSSRVLRSGMVDHYMIYAIRNVNAWRIRSKKSKTIETRSLRNLDKANFFNHLKEVNWELLISPFSESPN